jgi:hypothetical protein
MYTVSFSSWIGKTTGIALYMPYLSYSNTNTTIKMADVTDDLQV